jgi:formylglycine-generating enzyme required for sulfatase activity
VKQATLPFAQAFLQLTGPASLFTIGSTSGNRMITLRLLLPLTVLLSAHADDARFFRISGPVASTITAFSTGGYVTWTNSPTNATFTVQAAFSLVGPGNWVDYVQVTITNPITIHRLYNPNPPFGMTFIPAGTFTMGNCMDTNEGFASELPLHRVYVSAFFMDKYELTKERWLNVYHWATNHGYDFTSNCGLSTGTNHPAHNISWFDAVKWCNAKSEMEGRIPAYYTSASQNDVFRTGQTNLEIAYVKWYAGYRLPTEAEWEMAARGGVSGRRFPWADPDTITHAKANYSSSDTYAYDVSPTRGWHPIFDVNIWPSTSQVGHFAPNGYGLYDMAGNLREWCWDRHAGTLYSSVAQVDPRGPATGFGRIQRSGTYTSLAYEVRVASRDSGYPNDRHDHLGFRCVLPDMP